MLVRACDIGSEAEIEPVASLRRWPVVGKTYRVTSLWAGYGWVPVFPEPHTDQEITDPHWHVDARFLTPELEAIFAAAWPGFLEALKRKGVVREAVAELPLSDGLKVAINTGFSDPTGMNPPKVELRPMVCRYSAVQWDGPPRDHYWDKRVYLPKAPRDGTLKAVRSSDGRPLCPHQKFDLTCVWDGKSSHVRCPLHGLEIDVSNCARELEEAE